MFKKDPFKAVGFWLLSNFLALNVYADEVYRWVDDAGNEHFSTSPPPGVDAKPANLPYIGRENLEGRIQALKSVTPENCNNHGGVDCGVGADGVDGSVICLDGFRDAILPFRYACMEAALRAGKFQLTDLEGNILDPKNLGYPHNEPINLLFTIRNHTNVKADKIRVQFEIKGAGKVTADGPEEIEPYGIGEYTFATNMLSIPVPVGVLLESGYHVQCANCQSVVKVPPKTKSRLSNVPVYLD